MRKFQGKHALQGFLSLVVFSLAAALSPQAAHADDRYPSTYQSARAGAASGVPERFVDPLASPQDAAPLTSAAAYASHPRGRHGRAVAAAPGAYFIEFRSRYALSYGHTYAAFGRLDSRGRIISREVAGLHPAGESSVPWMIGHLVPVPSETGPSDGDLEDEYISNRYRVTMNEADYNKVVAKIRQMQRSTPLWSATVYNCNSFVGDIARYMGLRSDTSTLQTPPNYIAALRRLNGGRSSIPPNSL
ncbi:hypothetical protein [Enterovirga sp.]|uniref:hypothetical protein n=1 Tax=Enterovirga sp. TaxID=2026350 RepID=UPI002C6592CE|nr:hypothetical protein [Enterovirga sp.]HMO27883.1 hypothetical protein [Enterovirga sp.]